MAPKGSYFTRARSKSRRPDDLYRGRIRKRARHCVENQGSRILTKDLSDPDVRRREARVHLDDRRILIGQDQIDSHIPFEAWNRLYDLRGATERQHAQRVLKRDGAAAIPEPAPSRDLLEVQSQGDERLPSVRSETLA